MQVRAVLPPLMLAILLPCGGTAMAGAADVIDVAVRKAGAGMYDFDITIASDDRGWEHYADLFEVLAPDGRVLGTRVLLHPHEDEQPFTRDLHGIAIPQDIGRVTLRAHHKPLGYDGATMTVDLPD